MNITLCSAFRNSVANGHLSRYLAQCHDLDGALYEAGHRLSFVWGEGDSTDDTLKVLTAARWRFKAEIVDCAHGGAEFGSVVREERFRQLAHVGRCIWAAIPADADYVVYCESDLIWKPETIVAMIEQVGKPAYERYMVADRYGYTPDNIPTVDVIAPPILLDRPGWGKGVNFYDTFCYRRNGQRFEHRPPWHPDNDGKNLLELDMAGSCLAMSGERARGIVYDDRVLMGVCEQIRAKGGHVWFDPTLPPCLHQ